LKNICPVCEFENRKENKFCTQCGSKIILENKTGPRLLLLNDNSHIKTFNLSGKYIQVGRNIDNAIVLKDDQISKYHAEIYYSDNKFWIKDLESKNGVYVNGKRISKPAWLLPGCLLKLGATLLRFENQI
jgi:pSer/pThr/pTyr-binding forkhead associated (FHA) protein